MCMTQLWDKAVRQMELQLLSEVLFIACARDACFYIVVIQSPTSAFFLPCLLCLFFLEPVMMQKTRVQLKAGKGCIL